MFSNKSLLPLPHFLIIGAYSRNAGKTTFSCDMIRRYPGLLTALKVTIIKENSSGCSRGGEGCGVCTSLKKPFEITEETDKSLQKDTARLLKAGASRVIWLRVRENALQQGLSALLEELEPGQPVLCESNSLVSYINPGLFLLLKARGEERKKDSARLVEDRANLIIETDPEGSDFDLSRICHGSEGWKLS